MSTMLLNGSQKGRKCFPESIADPWITVIGWTVQTNAIQDLMECAGPVTKGLRKCQFDVLEKCMWYLHHTIGFNIIYDWFL